MALKQSRSDLYRQRANETREMAQACHHSDLKEQLEIIAAEYDDLAQQIEWAVIKR